MDRQLAAMMGLASNIPQLAKPIVVETDQGPIAQRIITVLEQVSKSVPMIQMILPMISIAIVSVPEETLNSLLSYLQRMLAGVSDLDISQQELNELIAPLITFLERE